MIYVHKKVGRGIISLPYDQVAIARSRTGAAVRFGGVGRRAGRGELLPVLASAFAKCGGGHLPFLS